MAQHRKNKINTKTIFDKGNKFVFKHFIAFFLSDNESHRIIIASKKIGNAVKRNKSKRRLREILRLYINPEISDQTILLIARTTTSEAPFKNLIIDTNALLDRIKSKIVRK